MGNGALLRWDLVWDAPKLSRCSGESRILTALAHQGWWNPQTVHRQRSKGMGLT